jgi:uncharacterized membrane protein
MGVKSLRAEVRWLVRSLGRNPLRRRLDRVAAIAILVLLAAAILVFPVAVAAGNASYAKEARAAAVAAETRRPVDAVVTGARVAHVITGPEHQITSYSAEVSWTGADGKARVETTSVPPTVVTGSKIQIWVDTADRVTVAPPNDAQLRASAVAFTLGIVMTGQLLCAGLIWCVRRIADAYALRAWNREWETVETKWLEY